MWPLDWKSETELSEYEVGELITRHQCPDIGLYFLIFFVYLCYFATTATVAATSTIATVNITATTATAARSFLICTFYQMLLG